MQIQNMDPAYKYEASKRLEAIQPINIDEIGCSDKWSKNYQNCGKINLLLAQQSSFDENCLEEFALLADEHKKVMLNMFIYKYLKINVLVKNKITMEIWRLKVLEELIQDDDYDHSSSLLLYFTVIQSLFYFYNYVV